MATAPKPMLGIDTGNAVGSSRTTRPVAND